jgi:hypothetical protein
VQRAATATSRTLQALILVIGLLLVVTTLARGGGPSALGVVLGVLFMGLGAARLYLSSVRSRPGERP